MKYIPASEHRFVRDFKMIQSGSNFSVYWKGNTNLRIKIKIFLFYFFFNSSDTSVSASFCVCSGNDVSRKSFISASGNEF